MEILDRKRSQPTYMHTYMHTDIHAYKSVPPFEGAFSLPRSQGTPAEEARPGPRCHCGGDIPMRRCGPTSQPNLPLTP